MSCSFERMRSNPCIERTHNGGLTTAVGLPPLTGVSGAPRHETAPVLLKLPSLREDYHKCPHFVLNSTSLHLIPAYSNHGSLFS